MSRLLASIRSWFRDPRTREFLLWCLPALLAGLVLRVVLMAQLPHAYYHDDAPDFLATPDKLLSEGEWDLHAKKTFLVPTIFTVPFLLRIPALIAIPLFQHTLGLGLVLLVGLLCRLWFRQWKVFIVPLTMLTAINPFFLWYEHTLMAETIFVFCTVVVALAGTLYAMRPSLGRLIFLCVALVLEAGGRPEGKLLFGFGLFLLILMHRREWKAMWPRVAAVFILGVATHFVTKTSQAGLLLYTSVVRLTPTELKIAPGFDPYIASIRTDLQQRWNERPQFPKVRDRRAVSEAVDKYLRDNAPKKKEQGHRTVNEFCLKLASETCKKNFFNLPQLVYHKFRLVANEAPSGLLNNDWLFTKQREAYIDSQDRSLRLSRGLTGYTIATADELNRFIDTHYGEVRWFNDWTAAWLRAVNGLRFPDTIYKEGPLTFTYPGIPLYFLLAALGVLAVMFRRGTLQPFHIAWGLTLLGFFYVIILTANVRPRFRFVFEPFWFIYIALLAESLWLAVTRLFARR